MVKIKKSELRKTLAQENIFRLEQIERTATPLLARTTNVLIEYTEHTVEHSLGVEQIYDEILKGKFDILNENEKFFLLAATILHDIGMVGTKVDLELPDYEKIVREQHHIFSRQRILQLRHQFGFDQAEANLIGKIAEAHRKVNLEGMEESYQYGIGSPIRVKLLGAMIRFADELHVTNDRAPEIVSEVLNPGKVSKMHHSRHQKVAGVGRSRINPAIIEISAFVDDWDLEESLMEMVREIEKKHKSVNKILEENEIIIAEISPNFDVEYLVQKEVLLELSNGEKSRDEILANLEARNPITVEQALDTLSITNIIEESEGQYSLNKDQKTFRYIFNKLSGTKNDINFISSKYVEENIDSILTDVALNIYGYQLNPGEVEDRALLLKSSPQAMDILLNKQSVHTDFGHLQRLQVLDVSILGGYLQDVTINPKLAEDGEILLAIQSIENDLHKNLGSLLHILKHVNQVEAEEKKK
ncbi:HD domain-containing protein [Priestia megaterium]|uniref:HD domain-containing protein n=1 Tax=Priestia megaterium TaxID=1404 RepID=UPI00237BDD4E|nr:HD domain-containing protein [Priestia megaterium]MDD9791670.1 HD domain-containing protein [Priestia megaterium]